MSSLVSIVNHPCRSRPPGHCFQPPGYCYHYLGCCCHSPGCCCHSPGCCCHPPGCFCHSSGHCCHSQGHCYQPLSNWFSGFLGSRSRLSFSVSCLHTVFPVLILQKLSRSRPWFFWLWFQPKRAAGSVLATLDTGTGLIPVPVVLRKCRYRHCGPSSRLYGNKVDSIPVPVLQKCWAVFLIWIQIRSGSGSSKINHLVKVYRTSS